MSKKSDGSFDRFVIDYPLKVIEKGNGKRIKLSTREELLKMKEEQEKREQERKKKS